MKIVADMNVLFSCFKSDSPKRKLIITSQYVKFYTPSFCIAELLKHKKEICDKARISEEEFSLLLEDLTLFVNVVKEETFKDCAPEALKMLSGHAKDAPYVSLAISLKRSGHTAGIWSNERRLKDLEKHDLKVFNTREMLELYGN